MILLSLLVFFYVTIVPMFSKKAVLVQSNIFSFLKFIPLLFGIIGGIIIFATFGHGTAPNHFFEPNLPPRDEPTPFNLTNCTPFLGIIASIPAIFFSFDGFYNSSSLETKMKNPQNFSKAMILGILVVAAIYLTFSLGMALGAKDGTIIGLENA
jgi:amino acid transporter